MLPLLLNYFKQNFPRNEFVTIMTRVCSLHLPSVKLLDNETTQLEQEQTKDTDKRISGRFVCSCLLEGLFLITIAFCRVCFCGKFIEEVEKVLPLANEQTHVGEKLHSRNCPGLP